MTLIASNFGWRVSTVVRGTRAVQECAMATRVAQRDVCASPEVPRSTSEPIIIGELQAALQSRAPEGTKIVVLQ